VAAALARRHRLDAGDGEEFAAWATAQLVEDDYAILRKFGGRSSVETYLTVVVRNLFRDYRNTQWGRWRPSAESRRLGPLAIRLEELLVRDGRPLREVVQFICARDASLTERQIIELTTRLPRRLPRQEIELDAGEGEELRADLRAGEPEVGDAARRVAEALRAAVTTLPDEDGLILRMHFGDGHTIAAIARALRLDQKALYRRIDALRGHLRAALESRGVDRAMVLEALGPGVSW
jgi:RNA polymerase sigma factor for flagellar operon FliA